jgi:hypothetical protein
MRPSFDVLEDRTAPATYNWTDADASHNGWWSNPNNWQLPGGKIPTTPPGAGDDVVLGLFNMPSLVDQSFAGTIRSLTIQAGYTDGLTLTRSLTIGAAGVTSSQADGTISGQSLIVAGGTFNVTGGTMANLALNVSSGATLTTTSAAT